MHTELFNLISEAEIGHISLADRADLFIIAPATANFIGKVANGIADDMLTTTVMATKAPVLIAPAMNVNMLTNPIYHDNEEKLKRFGYLFVPPVNGILACGWEGDGSCSAGVDIRRGCDCALPERPDRTNNNGDCRSNSRGDRPGAFHHQPLFRKMGYAIAKNAARRGARVILVSGPVNISTPVGVELVKIENARDMREAVMSHVAECTVVIKSAAVADYRPVERKSAKIKKQPGALTLELVRNPDILAELGK